MIKVLSIIGTRPEAIKTSMLHKLLLDNENFDLHICSTGQHQKILDDVLDFFRIRVDTNLNAHEFAGPLSSMLAYLLESLQEITEKNAPDLILVQGDTLSSFAGALTAFLNKIPSAHIESGLRTFDKWSPFPEEVFRKFSDMTGDLLFAPTKKAGQNLADECLDEDKIYITGNTAIDALEFALRHINSEDFSPNDAFLNLFDVNKKSGRKTCLLTLHRRENWGEKAGNILKKLDRIASQNELQMIFPVHPNPELKNSFKDLDLKHIWITESLPYPQFVWLMKEVALIFTDSGGIQEEGPHLGTPVIILRDETERPEGIEEKHNSFLREFDKLAIRKMLQSKNSPGQIYGDGKASERIMNILLEKYL